ncbi:MAG TPA: prepilin-type N-terminal cleavage/methylation domain-containing protein [Phycisphaerae bacterium]|nr:prepilin-type N-terminal cleavage/methylation domain-containing protein [Phycisphaerae bacterium]
MISPVTHSRSSRGLAGFTLLELNVCLVVMAAGLLGVAALMVRQSRQVARAEQWCASDPTFYLICQQDPWMKALNASADLETQAGTSAWQPPVTGEKFHKLTLVSRTQAFGSGEMNASVTVEVLPDGEGGAPD